MLNNVQCAYPDCREPVTGQCSGYNGSCGRFYCAKHSWGKYCFECAKEKRTDGIINEYSEIAQGVSRIKENKVRFVVSVVGIFLIIYILTSRDENIIFSLGCAYVVFALIAWVFYQKANSKLQMAKAEEISVEHPYFVDFYEEWKSQKNKANLKTALKVAGVIGLISVVGAQGLIKGSESIARDQLG